MGSNDARISKREKREGVKDAFVSHASEDRGVAVRLAKSLEAKGFSVWIDDSNIRAGGLLVPELMRGLQASSNIVVLWSEFSSKSEWVTTEWTSVVNLNQQKGTTVKKGVIPCRLDDTPLALFLLNYVFCDFRRSYGAGLQYLLNTLKDKIVDTPAPTRLNPPDFVKRIANGQNAVLNSLSAGNLTQAKKLQGELNSVVDVAYRQKPNDALVLTLVGYQKKNQYLIRHWKEMQEGKQPKDTLVDEAIKTFSMALSIQPDDPSVLNGIGSMFILSGDLDAAKFYVQRALDRAKQEQLPYQEAEHDLKLIQYLKARERQSGEVSR